MSHISLHTTLRAPLLAGRALVKLLVRVGVQLGVGLLVAGHVRAGLLPPRHPAHPGLVLQTCNMVREYI